MSFAEFIRGKRVVVVGPAPSIVGTKQRAKIDSYDVVVRINKALPVPASMTDDIGTRTTVLYNCLNTNPENGGVLEPKTLKRANVTHLRCPYPAKEPFLRDIRKAQRQPWGAIKLSWTALGHYNSWERAMQSRPNSGICAILDLLTHPIKELYITGFTFFKGGYYSAYRNLDEKQVHARMDKAGNHNQEKQLAFMRRRLLSDKRVVMDGALREIIEGAAPLMTSLAPPPSPTPSPTAALELLSAAVPKLRRPFGSHVVNIVSMNTTRMARCKSSADHAEVSVRQHPGIVPNRVSRTELSVRYAGKTYTFAHPASCTSNMPQFGCILAHLFVIKKVFEDNPKQPFALIGEDDLVFSMAPTAAADVDTLLGRAPSDWEIVNLMPSLTDDLRNMNNGLGSPFSDKHSHGTVLFAIKRRAAKRLWDMMATDQERHHDLGFLLRLSCKGTWCTNQWPQVRCDRLLAADITLYHCGVAYINTAMPLAYWDDREGFSKSSIATRDNSRCNAAIEAVVNQVLNRIEQDLARKGVSGARALTATIKGVPGLFFVNEQMAARLRECKVPIEVSKPREAPEKSASRRAGVIRHKPGKARARRTHLRA